MRRIAALGGLLLAAAYVICTAAFWRRKPKEPAPWTGPFSPAEYAAFVEVVRAELAALGAEGRLEDGYVTVESSEWRGRYGLENLAQLCRQHPRREWPGIVRAHLASLGRAQRAHAAGVARTFDEAAPLLALRLWPAEFLQQVPREHVLYREDLPGTVTVLVYDLPETIQQVRPEETTGWGKATDELFALGLDNVRRKPRPQIRRAELPGGVRLTVFSGNSFFVATEALRLAQFPGCTGRHGALVGVPTRHALLAYPIDGAQVVKAMLLLVPVILGIYGQGPGAVSPRLYWYHEGRFEDLPYILKDRQPQFAPPAEFIALIRSLAGQG